MRLVVDVVQVVWRATLNSRMHVSGHQAQGRARGRASRSVVVLWFMEVAE